MNSQYNSALRPSDSVRVVNNQDGAALLDIRQGVCLSMTPVGVRIWDSLRLTLSEDQITDSLTAEFSLPRQQISEDVTAFISSLTERGLLISTKRPEEKLHFGAPLRLLLRGHRILQRWRPRNRKCDRFLFWKALIALLVYDFSNLNKHFSRIHDFVQGWTISLSCASPNTVEQVCKAFNYACVWYPKRILCLQRSAVLTCLLRSCGVPAQMVIGAQKLPFKAHAWTEVSGRAINERRDVQAIYLVWERC